MNILDQSAKRGCTSCQLCATMCAREAIKIELNEDGFYRPVVDADKCTYCGLCTKVCYKFDEDVKVAAADQLAKTQLYSAWSNDDEQVRNTTSGGIGDLLANVLLKQYYKVVGCVYDDEKTRAEHRIATTAEELEPFRGSKYIQSYNFDAFKDVVKNCRQEKFAVFGTPCQIYALSRIAEIKKVRDNFFFVDLYCHGCPSIFAWKKYQQKVKDANKVDSFDKVEFRSKIDGWGVYCSTFFKDGKLLHKSTRNLKGFFELFFSDQILNDGCNDCKLRHSLDYTDIRLGDFWGKKYVGNTRGVSAVTLCTDKGVGLFDTIKLSIHHDVEDMVAFAPKQGWGTGHRPRLDARKAILSSLSDSTQTIDDACTALHQHQTAKERLVRYAKNVLAILPRSLTIAIKKVR